ncbi:MAG: potassium-transporting ATPase subunit C [Acidimicrobiia bacterium]|nr:potassium-transporting ATPase subunit C [Acidimicrobiia bacterium]
MRRQIAPAIVTFLAFTVICGIVYPLVVTGVAQVAFGRKANGSFLHVDGEKVGSTLVGQAFTSNEYFHPRPSAAGEGYDPRASSGSNLGPSNPVLVGAGRAGDQRELCEDGSEADPCAGLIQQREREYREINDVDPDTEIPIDAVTASGSGLDPHISVANAELQAARVAATRGEDVDDVLTLVDAHTEDPDLGFLGERRVNVLELNVALDARR